MDRRHFNRRDKSEQFDWPKPAVELLQQGIVDGWSSGVIREELKKQFGIEITRSAVMGKVFRLGLRNQVRREPSVILDQHKRTVYTVEWTPEMDEQLRMLKGKGNLQFIYKTMGISSRAVRARITELGLEPSRKKAGETGGATIKARRAREAARAAPVIQRPISAPSFPDDALPTLERPGVGFFELLPHHCRWPLWSINTKPTVDVQVYCGDTRHSEGSSWCKHHLRLAMPYPAGARPYGMR